MMRYLLFFYVMVLMAACSPVRQMEKKPRLTVTPDKLELFVNQKTDPYTVQVKFTLHVPYDYVPSAAEIVYAPRFITSGHEQALKPVVIRRKDSRYRNAHMQIWENTGNRTGEEIFYETEGKQGMEIEINQTVPFMLWMPQSELVATVSVRNFRHGERVLYSQILADGMVYIPSGPGPVRVKYVKKEVEERKQQVFSFYFHVNNDDLESGENLHTLDQLTAWINKIQQDTAARIEKIIITGYSSPEGAYNYNQWLSKRRAGAVKNYLLSHFSLPDREMEMKSVAEDWEGLENLVEDSSDSWKQNVLQWLDSSRRGNEKETLLRKSVAYPAIEKYFLPRLRKATCEIEYVVRKTVEEVVPE